MKIKVEKGSSYYYVTIGKTELEVIMDGNGLVDEVVVQNDDEVPLTEALREKREAQAIEAVEKYIEVSLIGEGAL